MTPPDPLPRLSVGIVCDDPARVAAAYVGLLGFAVVSDRGWYVHLRHAASGAELGLLRRGGPDRPDVPRAMAALGPPDGVWISLEVPDLAAAWDLATAQAPSLGVTIVQPPIDRPWGESHFLIRDPAGTLVNVCHKATTRSGAPGPVT